MPGEGMSETQTLERPETAATETQVEQETEAQAEDLEDVASKTETPDDEEDDDPRVKERVEARLAAIEAQRESDLRESERKAREAKTKKDVREAYDTAKGSISPAIAKALTNVPLTYQDEDGRTHQLVFTAGGPTLEAVVKAAVDALDGFNLHAGEHHWSRDRANAVEAFVASLPSAERDPAREKLGDAKPDDLLTTASDLIKPKTLDDAVKRWPHLAPQLAKREADKYKAGRENPRPAGEGKATANGTTRGRMTLQEIEAMPNSEWRAIGADEADGGRATRQRILDEARAAQ